MAVPSLEFFLAKGGEVKQYIFTKTFDEAKNDPLAVIHTSGSTGLPKPVVLKHGWFAAMDAQIDMPPMANGERAQWLQSYDRILFAPLPPFHVRDSLHELCSSVDQFRQQASTSCSQSLYGTTRSPCGHHPMPPSVVS